MMHKRLGVWLLLLIVPLTACGQSTIPVSGQKVVDNANNPLNGVLVFTVTDTSDTPITYTPQGGSPTSATIVVPVSGGKIATTAGFPPQIPNPLTMAPANTRYRIQALSGVGGTLFYTLPLVNITTSNWSYDGYAVPPGIVATGLGRPQLPCAPGAQYTQTDASFAYNWVCSQIRNSSTLAWTQNPALPPNTCQQAGQAFVSAAGTAPYCIDSVLAYATAGMVIGVAGATPGPFSAIQSNASALTPVAPIASRYFTGIDSGGNFLRSQPGFSDLAGTLGSTQLPSLAGDVSSSAGSNVLTLATVNSNVGSCGDATHVGQATYDAKGRATGCVPVAISGATPITPAGPVSHQFLTSVNSSAVFTLAQPGFADLSGAPSAAQIAAAGPLTNSITGNAATATQLAAAPAQCPTGQVVVGITVTGTPNCTSSSAAVFPGTHGIVYNTSASTSMNATAAQVIGLWSGAGPAPCTGANLLQADGNCGAPGGSANFASPPALGNTAANQVFATLAQAQTVFVQTNRVGCSINTIDGKGCMVVNLANETGWTRGSPGIDGASIQMNTTGPGVADASTAPRLNTGLNINNMFGSPSITHDISITSNKIAGGDYIPLGIIAYQRGAWVENSDQGFNGIFMSGGSPPGHPTYTIATGGTGSTSPTFTGAPAGCVLGSYGGDTCKRIAQGSFLLDINDAPVATTAIGPSVPSTTCATWLQSIPVTAASLPAASTWGCALGVNINPNTLPNAPVATTITFTAGSGLFTAGQHVTVAGSNHYEQSTITTATGTAGAQTITLPLAYPNTNISVWAGGIEGEFISTDAVLAASGGTHRTSYPIAGNPDTSTIVYLIPQQGQMSSGFPRGTGDPTHTNGDSFSGLHLYCGARVSNVSDTGIPDLFTIEPNRCTWVPGNLMEQPDNPAQFVAGILMETKMNAPGALNGLDNEIYGFGAAGSLSFGFNAGNWNTPCFQTGGLCVGTTMRPPIAAYGIGINGPTGIFDNAVYSTLMPFDSVVKVNGWNPGRNNVVNGFYFPDGRLTFSGYNATGARTTPYQWRVDADGTGSLRASYFAFNKDSGYFLGIAPTAPFNASVGTTVDPATGYITPSGTLETGGLILHSLTASTSPVCPNGTNGALTTTGCSGISGLTANYIPLAGSATTLTGNSPLDFGVTTTGVLTSSAPTAVHSTTTASRTTWVPNGVAPAVPAAGFAWGIAATVTTPSQANGPDAPCSGLVTWTNASGIMSTTCTAPLNLFAVVPTGTVNGTNATFTVPNAPRLNFLFRNGVFQVPSVNYSISGTTITFNTGFIPQTGDSLYDQAIY